MCKHFLKILIKRKTYFKIDKLLFNDSKINIKSMCTNILNYKTIRFEEIDYLKNNKPVFYF